MLQAYECLISFIIPCYNSASYLPTLLNQMLSDDISNCEIILVDDGSTDKTSEICNEYKRRYNLIKIISIENSGVSYARNLGLRNAEGEYIVFYDSDDEIYPGTIEYYKKCIVEHEERDVFMFDYITCKKGVMSKRRNEIKQDVYSANDFFSLFLYNQIRCGVYSLLIKNEFLVKNHIFFNTSVSFGEDYLFIFEILCNLELVYYDSRNVYKWYVRDTSVSNMKRYNPRRFQGFVVVKNQLCLYLKKYPELKKSIQFFLADMYCANLQVYLLAKNAYDKEIEQRFYDKKYVLEKFILKGPIKKIIRISVFKIIPIKVLFIVFKVFR